MGVTSTAPEACGGQAQYLGLDVYPDPTNMKSLVDGGNKYSTQGVGDKPST